MSENNGAEVRTDLPIKYPSITIPNRGTFTVKFGLGASFTLEDELGVSPQQFAEKFQEWIPKVDPETGTVLSPGRTSNSFLLKVLSACIWDQVQLSPRQLADSFDIADMPMIARTVAEAFSKTRWSARVELREPATLTSTEQAKPN